MTTMTTMPTTNWRVIGWGGAAALLLLPLVAMQFTREVNWTGSDFLVFGAMLIAAGGGIELATRARLGRMGKLVAAGAVIAAFLLVWVELAVGLFH